MRLYLLALLRIVIGWHFFYEGWVKLIFPGWSSGPYLRGSSGPLAWLFHALASHSAVVAVIDQINIWGLLAVGLGLMLGVLARYAAWGGMALLALYYCAYPPLFAVGGGSGAGHFLLVNNNLIELLALAVVAVFPAPGMGLEAMWARRTAEPEQPGMSRRELVTSLAGVPVLGALVLAVLKKHGWKSFEEIQLGGKGDTQVASATVKRFAFTPVSALQGRLPRGKIGDLTLSRMILGGNLIGGWAHARDLVYVSKLVKAYHNRDKIYETFALAESCSVNAIITNPVMADVINDYWRNGGKIQFISDCGGKDILAMTQKSIDQGAAACYIQGGVADKLVEDGKFDLMAKALELTRRNGLPAGIGGHKLETIQKCVEKGLRPDFWMKTLHNTNYWSAKPEPECDNIWCADPVKTAEYMQSLKEPWIAFKILAAGALEPKVAFKHAFESGADFICVGMYDFQIVDDVNLALATFKGGIVRSRQWCA